MAWRRVSSFVGGAVGSWLCSIQRLDHPHDCNPQSAGGARATRSIHPNLCRPDVARNAFQLAANPVRQS
jgi:hypothetical protein